MDICFSLPRSIPAIAEKRTQKIAGTRSSKFVFYGIGNYKIASSGDFENASNLECQYEIVKSLSTKVTRLGDF